MCTIFMCIMCIKGTNPLDREKAMLTWGTFQKTDCNLMKNTNIKCSNARQLRLCLNSLHAGYFSMLLLSSADFFKN